MEKQEIYSHVDHTQLKAVSTWQDIRKLCEEALAHHTASVCIPPSYVARAHEHFPALNICTVIGLSLIHISEPTRLGMISYAVFCLKKKKKKKKITP